VQRTAWRGALRYDGKGDLKSVAQMLCFPGLVPRLCFFVLPQCGVEGAGWTDGRVGLLHVATHT